MAVQIQIQIAQMVMINTQRYLTFECSAFTLTLKLPGPYAGMGGSVTVTVA